MLVLYSYFRSSCSWRVRIALAMKDLKYEYRPINLIKEGGEQFKSEYKELNELSQVPTLIDNGLTLTQSIPIIEYLNEAYSTKGVALLPKEIDKRAQSRMVAEMINSGIQPIQNLTVLKKMDEGQRKEWAHFWINRGFQALETVLEKTSGKCCVGDEVSIADICLVPQVYNALRFNVDLNQYPTISRIDKYLNDLPEFRASHPNEQVDCPDDLKASS